MPPFRDGIIDSNSQAGVVFRVWECIQVQTVRHHDGVSRSILRYRMTCVLAREASFSDSMLHPLRNRRISRDLILQRFLRRGDLHRDLAAGSTPLVVSWDFHTLQPIILLPQLQDSLETALVMTSRCVQPKGQVAYRTCRSGSNTPIRQGAALLRAEDTFEPQVYQSLSKIDTAFLLARLPLRTLFRVIRPMPGIQVIIAVIRDRRMVPGPFPIIRRTRHGLEPN